MERLRTTPRTTILAIGIAILVISSAFGYWLNVGDDDKEVVAWVVVCIVASVIMAALLLRFVPATSRRPMETRRHAARSSLGAAALITCIVFWTTPPIVLGIPALVLAAEGRAAVGRPTTAAPKLRQALCSAGSPRSRPSCCSSPALSAHTIAH